jgi:hypothetical protein
MKLLVALALTALTAPTLAQDSLSDGIYLVQRSGEGRRQVTPVQTGEVLLIHDYRYLDEKIASERRQQLIVVATVPDVPLVLRENPLAIEEEDGGRSVEFRLAEPQTKALDEFSRSKIGRTIAIVIQDMVVSSARLQGRISDGRVRVTGCRDYACDLLLEQLREMVVEAAVPAGDGS